jgi:hypothetical protein
MIVLVHLKKFGGFSLTKKNLINKTERFRIIAVNLPLR